MKSTSVAIVSSLAIFLVGCTSFSKTSHLFEFYGSTQESYGRDFFYVQYGVSGAATATYTSRGGGYVRDGLIADAKKNLIAAHPLGPNQSYVNMSIDISKTESGPEPNTITRIELTATISADVIQFGQPPMDYTTPLVEAVPSIVSFSNSQESPTQSSPSQSSPEITEVTSEGGLLKVGDLVAFTVRLGEEARGEVTGFIQTPNGNIANVKFTFEGEERTSTLPVSSLRRVVKESDLFKLK